MQCVCFTPFCVHKLASKLSEIPCTIPFVASSLTCVAPDDAAEILNRRVSSYVETAAYSCKCSRSFFPSTRSARATWSIDVLLLEIVLIIPVIKHATFSFSRKRGDIANNRVCNVFEVEACMFSSLRTG